MVKNEFGVTAKRSDSAGDTPAATEFSRFKSRSMSVLPLATIIFCRVPVWLCELSLFGFGTASLCCEHGLRDFLTRCPAVELPGVRN